MKSILETAERSYWCERDRDVDDHAHDHTCIHTSYPGLVETFAEIVVSEDMGTYQGDTFFLLRDEDGCFGYLTVGWGSCSGCDALESCDSLEEIEALRDSLAAEVMWASAPVLASYFVGEAEWQTHWYYSEDRVAMYRFIGKSLMALAEAM